MIAQNLLSENLFTINIATTAFIGFGGIDEETCAGREQD